MSKTRKALTPEQKEAKAAYDSKYIMSHIKQKRINFNDQNPEDVKLLGWLEQQPNESRYMKDLISEDMIKAGE